MSLVKTIEQGKMTGKIFKVKQGYYFKIFVNNRQIAQMFYYAPTEAKALEEVFYAFDAMDEERFNKL